MWFMEILTTLSDSFRLEFMSSSQVKEAHEGKIFDSFDKG